MASTGRPSALSARLSEHRVHLVRDHIEDLVIFGQAGFVFLEHDVHASELHGRRKHPGKRVKGHSRTVRYMCGRQA